MLLIKKLPKAFGWKVEKKTNLPGNPYAVAVKDPSSFYFVTGDGLYSIDWKTEKNEKLKDSFMTGLYPSSLVVGNDKRIYVGMRHAVARFTPVADGYDVRWLVKARCTGE
jgi:hypothetical protein